MSKTISNTKTWIGGKTIALDCGALDWEECDAGGTPKNSTTPPKTDNTNGAYYVLVSRMAADEMEPKKDYLLRGSLNLLNATCNVAL